MQKLRDEKNRRWAFPLLCLLLCILGAALYGGYLTRVTAAAAGVFLAYLLATSDLRALKTPLVLPLCGCVVFAALTALWAMSGKFFLREYLKIFAGAAICAWLLLRPRFDGETVRRVLSLVAGTSAVYAFLNVEIVTTGITRAVFAVIMPDSVNADTGWRGTRLWGVFGNPNLEAGITAIGVILSVALLCHAAERRERVLCAVMLSFNAYAFLLAFSMGALACFAAAIVLYLVFSGEERGAALVRMLEAAIPTVLFSMAAYLLFVRGGSAAKLPLPVMLLNAAVTVWLELTIAPRLTGVSAAHKKATVVLPAAVFALAALYIVLGVTIHGAHTFGNALSRPVYLAPGEHALTVQADGEITVSVVSLDKYTVMGAAWNGETLYFGTDREIAFTVPDDSEVVNVAFSAEPGVVLSSAVLDGKTGIPLDYPLLPGFAAERIQGVRTSSNAVQRRIYMEDAVKLWRLSPVAGNGLGAFETGVTRVQDFPYKTRYVHSHYFQTLLEGGVIGLALWLATLGSMAVALWRRRKAAESPDRWAYAALWAALAMMILHSAWDVVFSFWVYILYAYALFGLILRVCAVEPEAAKIAAAEAARPKSKKRAVKKEEFSLARTAVMLLPVLFVLTLCANMLAQSLGRRSVSSYEEFFSNMDLAVKLDAYEHNDEKLSYVVAAAQNWKDVSDTVRKQADAYAEELSKVQSNSIPLELTRYYLATARYEKAIDAAKLCAVYSASDAQTWNEAGDLFRKAFADPMFSPLATEGEPLVRELLAYRALLDAHNAAAIVPVALSAANEAFFEKVAQLSPYPDDLARVFEILAA